MSEPGYEIIPEKVKNTAIHEAGHAAVALYLNRKVTWMTVHPTQRKEDGAILRGFCTVDERVIGARGDQGFFAYEEDLIIAKGSLMAECAFGIAPHPPALTNDLPPGPTKLMLEAFNNDMTKFWKRMEEINKAAHEIVNKPEIIEAIKQIAQLCTNRFAGSELETVRLVTGDEVKEAYKRAISKVHIAPPVSTGGA